MSLSDLLKRAPSEDVFRFLGVDLYVPTDEQIAKARDKGNNYPIHASIKVRWEPMTYRKFIGDDQITEEVDYLKVTTGKGLSAGDEARTLELVRSGGFLAIPADVRASLPDMSKADPDKQTVAFARFMVAAHRAGIVLDVDNDGKLVSSGVGKIFACRNGAEQFPTVNEGARGKDFWNWENTRSEFMRVPLREVTDFVQPDQIPERRYERKEGSDEQASAGVTTTAAPAALSTDALRAAVAQLGIEGKTVSVVNASAVSLLASNISKAPTVFGNGEVSRAAQSGDFVGYLVNKDAVNIADGKVVLVG